MKNHYKFRLVLLSMLALLWTSACEDDEVQPVDVMVQLTYPTDFSTQQVESGITVTMNSSTGSNSYTAQTDASGAALFEGVIPGSYDVTATQALDAAQALTITGIFNDAINLNAASSVSVLASPVDGQNFSLELSGVPAGDLVFKEVYYTGVPDFYFSDQFIEIYNNSGEEIFLDGLYIADIWGASGQINPTTTPSAFVDDTDHVYANSVWQIPGSGEEYPLAPGQSIIIAQDGIDHTAENENTTVDLSTADWETFNQRDDNRDVDAPNVPNLERVYFTGGFDWLITVFGPALVIFRTDDFAALEQVQVPDLPDTFAPRIQIPNSLVIDTFEGLRDAESSSFQRIPAALDAGFVFATDTYVGESFRRKVALTEEGRTILQDTNNSGNDFERLDAPTPGVIP